VFGAGNLTRILNASQVIDFTNAAQNTYVAGRINGLNLKFYTNAGSGIDIDSTGRVGIGTSTPAVPLDVVGIGRFTGGGGYVSFGDNGYIRTDAANELRFQGGSSGTSFWKSGLASESVRIDNSGRLLVGTSSARANFTSGARTSPFQVEGTTLNDSALSILRNSNDTGQSGIYLAKSRSTTVGDATPDIVADGDSLGSIFFQGADNTNFVSSASITAQVDGTPGSNDMPGRIVLSTTSDGASSPTERMRIDSSGITSFYNSNVIYSYSTAAAGTSNNVFLGRYGATIGNTGSGTNAIIIWNNGNVVNANNSYGAISDIKLKENIVDANSQWDDLKALQVRNYNFKEGQTHTQIGLVAQEVELISPGLVTESPDRDAEGNDLGTVTKSVNYSVLYMKAVKALQEAMERIESLEAKVAALEGE
jgi:hypothetical protein